MDGLPCQRPGCGLPLRVHHEGAEGPRIWHVERTAVDAEGGVVRTLSRNGRGGCRKPTAVYPEHAAPRD